MKGIKSHYVPQSYLRNFGNPIYQYNKKDKKMVKIPPRRAAARSNYYAYSEQSEIIEKAFGEIEGSASTAIRKIVQSESLSTLSASDIVAICSFITLQFARTPEFRESRREMVNRLYDKKVKSAGVTDFTIREKEESANMWHTSSALQFYEAVTPMVMGMRRHLLKNDTPMPLWTSDNPVVFSNKLTGKPEFGSPEMEIYLPLTPKLLLVLCGKWSISTPRGAVNQTAWGNRLCSPHVLKAGSMELRDVLCANHLQVKLSTQFVFSNECRFRLMEIFRNAGGDSKWWHAFRFSADTQHDDAVVNENWVAADPLAAGILQKNAQDARWWYRPALREVDCQRKFFLLYKTLDILVRQDWRADASGKEFDARVCSLARDWTLPMKDMRRLYAVVKSGWNADTKEVRRQISVLLGVMPKVLTRKREGFRQ